MSLLVIAVGCSSDESEETHKKNIQNLNIKNNDPNGVKYVVIEDSPEHSSSPSDAVTNQYKFVFENDKKCFITKSDIANEVVLGNKGIVILDTHKYHKNFVVLPYEKEKKWDITALIDVDIDNSTLFENKEGLNLPFDKFAVAKYLVNEPNIWVFANKEKLVAISKYTHYSFDNKEVKGQKMKNGKEIFISEDPNNPYIYYYDSNFIVVISGTISKEEMVLLAESIGPVTSREFPLKGEM